MIGKTTNLKKSQAFGIIYINKDLTRKEIEQEKDLRRMLKEKIENGELGWKIKKGKLIKETESNYENVEVFKEVDRRSSDKVYVVENSYNNRGKNYTSQGRGRRV